MQLTGAQLNYPVHEKELLAIIRGLKKWCSDLLGSHVEVYTDHRTLENFEGQKDLSRCQARWLEVMSQFEMTISYIKGEDNCVADALSQLPPDASPVTDADPEEISSWKDWLAKNTSSVNMTFSISSDMKMLDMIRSGYKDNKFCSKFVSGDLILPEVKEINGLWYIGDRLLVPRVGMIHEDLFHLAHETLGHFGTDKSYATLWDSFYWLNMQRDLEQSFIPGCIPCQRNKSSTTKPAGPLHPLPIPDECGNNITMDFIGPLPEDEGFNCLLTITDRLGSDVRLIPTCTDITAEKLATVFFENWYCMEG